MCEIIQTSPTYMRMYTCVQLATILKIFTINVEPKYIVL